MGFDPLSLALKRGVTPAADAWSTQALASKRIQTLIYGKSKGDTECHIWEKWLLHQKENSHADIGEIKG